MLKIYGQSDIYPFHMPGHKRRLGPSETEHLYEMDITEIDGFDNLHEPEGILKDAQTFLQQIYTIRKKLCLLLMVVQRGSWRRLREYAVMAERFWRPEIAIKQFIMLLSSII